MTTPTDRGQSDPAAQMEAATADIERLQDLLRRAAQGQAGAGEVAESMNRYWSDHRNALKTAAGAVGEEARGQMLDQLCRMREQSERQLQGRSSVRQQPDSGTASEQHGTG